MNEEDRAALQNEIDILKQVDHPNIVKLHDIYEDEKHFFLVMELMTGGEVSHRTQLSSKLLTMLSSVAFRPDSGQREVQREGGKRHHRAHF